MTDRATTYILDGDFESFIKKAADMIPDWWAEALMFPGDYEVDW
jgi:hypothetical protein